MMDVVEAWNVKLMSELELMGHGIDVTSGMGCNDSWGCND